MTPSRHSPQPLSLDAVLAQSARDAKRQHGCGLLDVRALSPQSQNQLPGSARLPVAGTRPALEELPSHMLPEPGRPLIVLASEAMIAAAVASELSERGWPSDYLADMLPTSALQPGLSFAALWRPDAFVQRCLEYAPVAGRGVDFGCGNGRDLVYLAQCGWEMLGIDRLPDGLELAQRRADTHAVQITTQCADARELARAGRRFELGLCIRYTELVLLQNVFAWLQPGGLFLFHGYGRDAQVPPPRTMRARNRLSIASAQEIFDPAHWEFVWEPTIEWLREECWLYFLARRSGV